MVTMDNYAATNLQGTLQDFQNLLLKELVKSGTINVRESEEDSQKLTKGQMEFDFVSKLDPPTFFEKNEQDSNN